MKQFEIQVLDKMTEIHRSVLIVNGESFSYKASGLTRHVFANENKTKVVKILVDPSSYDFNKEEIEFWDTVKDSTRENLAQTEALPNGWIVQEYLHTLDDPSTEESISRSLTMDEIRFAGSCRNDVGFDKNGKLKCYDLHEYKKY